jgi:hypothetical protein
MQPPVPHLGLAMKRFSPILRRALRRRLASGDFAPKDAEYISKLLSSRGKRRSRAWEEINAECAKIKGCTAANIAADQEESDRPVLDWILHNWDKILAVVIAIVMQFLL